MFRVLLVEDKEGQAKLVAETIRTCGCEAEIDSVMDARHARERAASGENYDLILFDSRMPGMDGKELLRLLRQNKATKFTPAVVFTAVENQSDVNEYYELGANSYLVKPFEYDELCRMMASTVKYWMKWNKSPGREF